MPSIFSHAIAAIALGKVYAGGRMPARFWWLSAFCAILPDFDVFLRHAFSSRGSPLGHRGLTHSLLFALLVALCVVLFAFRRLPAFSVNWWKLLLYFFIVTASHGLLDALTDGGSGVAFFAPFDSTRYFFPARPIEVSPMGLRFFSSRGLVVIASEMVWVWLPSFILILAAWVYRRLRARGK
jgi:inner membrane protein